MQWIICLWFLLSSDNAQAQGAGSSDGAPGKQTASKQDHHDVHAVHDDDDDYGNHDHVFGDHPNAMEHLESRLQVSKLQDHDDNGFDNHDGYDDDEDDEDDLNDEDGEDDEEDDNDDDEDDLNDEDGEDDEEDDNDDDDEDEHDDDDDDDGNHDNVFGDHPNAKVTHMKEFVNVVVLSDHG